MGLFRRRGILFRPSANRRRPALPPLVQPRPAAGPGAAWTFADAGSDRFADALPASVLERDPVE
jgi:hypothetical protein